MGAFTRGDNGRCLGSGGCLAIPAHFAAIANCARRSNQDIRSVTILGLVTRIGGADFSCRNNLGYINLPPSLKAMGEYAFSSCKLKNLAIPGTLKVIPFSAFSHCALLNQTSHDNGVQTISSQAFADSGRALKIYIPSSVTHIAEDAFEFFRNSSSNSKLEGICASPDTLGKAWASKHPDVAIAVQARRLKEGIQWEK